MLGSLLQHCHIIHCSASPVSCTGDDTTGGIELNGIRNLYNSLPLYRV